jgi:hypothetical protein
MELVLSFNGQRYTLAQLGLPAGDLCVRLSPHEGRLFFVEGG